MPAGLRLETADLALSEVGEDDLDAIVAVRLSNPDRLARTEGTAAGPGGYDRGMLERDLAVAAYDEERHLLCVRLRDGGRVVGFADVLDAHPDEGVPWLGAVEIAAADQRRGYGRQCVEVVARRARDELGQGRLRAAADGDDETAAAFLGRLGFSAVGEMERRAPGGPVTVIVFERNLNLDPGPVGLERLAEERGPGFTPAARRRRRPRRRPWPRR